MVKFTVNIATKPGRGRGGYGNVRSGHAFMYGTFAKYANKSGIYFIKCNVNNMIYIGSSKNIQMRLSKHFGELRKNKHTNSKLQKDYNKYGQNSFEFGVLEYTTNDLLGKENQYQKSYDINSLYNEDITNYSRSISHTNQSYYNSRIAHKTKTYREKMHNLKKNLIGQFAKDGTFIKLYKDSNEACNASGLAKSTILGCCNGSKKSGAGYIWRYIDDDGNVLANGIGKERVIIGKVKI